MSIALLKTNSMAKFKTDDLLNELEEDVRKIIAVSDHLKGLEKGKLIYQSSSDKWSVVQVLEHLNAYGRYYLPAIEKAIIEDKGGKDAWFHSGRLGNYFTNSMKPKNVYEIKNKMKSLKDYKFPNSLNVDIVLREFADQKTKLMQLLQMARERNLNSIRIPITISKLIRLKLGDIFRFLIAHDQRHMIQARNTLKATGVPTDRFPVILQGVAR
jgi:uncharacterized damage-inducible protein DinB